MTQSEWYTLAKHFKAGFERQKFLESKNELDVWYSAIKDIDFKLAKEAAKQCICNNHFAPTVSDFVDQVNRIKACNNAYNQQIKRIYMEMEEYYPVCLRDKDRKSVFIKVISGKTASDAIANATRIKKSVISVVKSVENGYRDHLPSMSDCIRECADNERE